MNIDPILRSIVTVRSSIPEDAFTARALGTQREGSGVVIRENGLVLTIGYLITEAEEVWLTSSDGRVVPAHALAYDQETGFGLVQALGRLDLPGSGSGRRSRNQAGRSRGACRRDRPMRSRRPSWPSRNSPAIGSICWTRRSSSRQPIPGGEVRH